MEEHLRRWIERRYGVDLSAVDVKHGPTVSSWTDIKDGRIVVNVSPVERILGRTPAAMAHELAHAAQILRLAGASANVREAMRHPLMFEADALEAERAVSRGWPGITQILPWIFPPLGYALWRYRKLLRAMEEMGVGIHPEKFYRLERLAWKEHRSLRAAAHISNAFLRLSSWLAERGRK